jgi:hypothetical protein
MRVHTFVPAVLLTVVATGGLVLPQSRVGAPETFTANLHVAGGTTGAAAASIEMQVRRYTPDADRTAVETALKTGGYTGFLTALRQAPDVGAVVIGAQKWAIRWAREQKTPKGRTITLVTDQPIFFVGGGKLDAKPRAGYEVAVIQFQIDDVGLGNGSMAAAARVKPGGDTGVQIDDYADKPIKMTTVTRKIQ